MPADSTFPPQGARGALPPPLTDLELAALCQAAGLVVFAAWAFGGQIGWARIVISVWGSLAPVVTLLAVRSLEVRRAPGRASLRWLWPLLFFNLLVLAGCLNPSFTPRVLAGEAMLVHTGARIGWLPSAAAPGLSLAKLWLFDGIYLSAFNLALVVRRRRTLRGLLMVLAANALALAIFGTLQKLVAAPGLYFGAMPSPNLQFFSTFVYANHWGAFIVLSVALCLGLLFHHARRQTHRNFWHSPAFAGLVAIFLIAATAPLSASRSGALLVFFLLLGALLHWLLRLIRERRREARSVLAPATASLVIAALAFVATYELSRRTIDIRVDDTTEQIAQMRTQDDFGNRQYLYRDTLRMGLAQPAFGWGWGCYATVFRMFQSGDEGGGFYQEAHSDWLQTFAEVGAAGLVLLLLLGALPLAAISWRRLTSLPGCLLAGCGLIVLYAWLEFPFANPAVDLLFWTCFFCAIKYALLNETESACP